MGTKNETTCKTCYWYRVCPERSRLYPCREYEETRRKSGRDVADLWTIGGICLIRDMLPTARRVEEAEHEQNAARTAYEHARDAYNELLQELAK